MKITVEILFAIDNPLPDFPEQRYVKQIEAEISDEDIQRLGKRYFELESPVMNQTICAKSLADVAMAVVNDNARKMSQMRREVYGDNNAHKTTILE